MDVRFAWGVPERGHNWMKRGVDEQELAWGQEKKGGFVRKYVPDMNLFREFAALNTSKSRGEDAVRKFADKYGDILAIPGDSFYQPHPNPVGEERRQVKRPSASLRLWRFQVEQMEWAVKLWDESKDPDATKTSRLSAREALQIEVESALQDAKTPSYARVYLNARFELFVHPVNLLAFMWLTIARLLSGEIEERLCAFCKKKHFYIGMGPGLHRADQKVCGATCRKGKQRGLLKSR